METKTVDYCRAQRLYIAHQYATYFAEGSKYKGPIEPKGIDSFHKWFIQVVDGPFPTQYFLNEILEEYLVYVKQCIRDHSDVALGIRALIDEIPSGLPADKEEDWKQTEKFKELTKKVVKEPLIRARKLTDEELKDWERRQELEVKQVDETKFLQYRGSDFDVRF